MGHHIDEIEDLVGDWGPTIQIMHCENDKNDGQDKNKTAEDQNEKNTAEDQNEKNTEEDQNENRNSDEQNEGSCENSGVN